MPTSHIPVIAIDGPTASGKGTVAHRVADKLGYHYLDSGALYRLTALTAIRRGTDLTDEHALAKLAEHLPCSFVGGNVILSQETSATPSAPRRSATRPPRSPCSRRCATR